jgi:hypothetical protein
MELEIKPVYNDFYNKILETSDNQDNQDNQDNHEIDSHSHLSSSELSNKSDKLEKLDKLDKLEKLEKQEKSSELSKEEVFKKLNKIIQAENPKNINLNANTKENKPNNKKSINKINSQFIPNKQNEKSDNYTNSSGLGEDNINFKNMYLQNMQRMQTSNNNVPAKQNNFQYHSSSEQKNVDSDEDKKNNNKNINMFGNQVKKSKKFGSGSLLDTNSDSEIRNKNNIIYEPNKSDSSVASEFKQFFSKNRKAKLDDGKPKDNNQKQLEKLEKYYDKAIEKKHKNKETLDINKNKNKDKKDEIIDEKKYKKKDVVKLMLNSVEKNIFEESTRGFNIENSIYKLDIQKLKTNLFNFKIDKDSKCTIGYLYRNFLNPKIYNTINNETSFWMETTKISNSTNLIETELEPKNKFLVACLKNFKKTKKFKKQIGSSLFRANIKTVELLNTPNKLIIDVIFFVRYKIQ